jgi:hypothetical protein
MGNDKKSNGDVGFSAKNVNALEKKQYKVFATEIEVKFDFKTDNKLDNCNSLCSK